MNMSKYQKVLSCLFAVSSMIIILGFMLLLTAAEIVPIFKGMYKIDNIIGRYVIVIVTMAIGIMSFSILSSNVEDKKIRNGMTIGITAFSTIVTLPLLYVFIAVFFAENGVIGPIGKLMMIDKIVEGFHALFGKSSGIYIIYILLFVMSVVFIAFPLLTGTLTVRGKTIKIGKLKSGKFGIALVELPVIVKQREIQD